MDGSTVEHSDSDSGESWTLLENTPTYGHETPDFPESATIPSERVNVETHSEKDDDTDGISIISDSDHESASCEISFAQLPTEEIRPVELLNFQNFTSTPPTNISQNNEPIRDETDFLGDRTKFKTYVHKRNHKVGTILDIIMLGTFVITAGMALGHLWSSKNECTPQTSVNKILSNLYKLQEENAYLRNQLKEITIATGYQPMQRKSDKPVTKKQRCNKIFEEPIIKNNNADPGVRCVNDNKSVLKSHDLVTPEHEKELLNDFDKMKEIYDHNKDWLDENTKKQYDEFIKTFDSIETKPKNENLDKHLGPKQILLNKVQTDVIQDSEIRPSKAVKSHKQINLEKQLGPPYYDIPPKREADTKENEINSQRQFNLEQQVEPNQNQKLEPQHIHNDTIKKLPIKKITYADSLKIEQPLQRSQRTDKNDKPSIWTKDHAGKKKHKYDIDLLNLHSISEDVIKKDDRYTGPKTKHEKKKHDRQKSHKKQKRNNKYEQWEMKGGYLKDFDELSLASSQSDNNLLINPDKMFKDTDFENYVIKFIEAGITDKNAPKKDQPKMDSNSGEKPKREKKHELKGDKPRRKAKTKVWEWYDQRSALRAEARMKLEHELFGGTIPNNAAWYFRRMQKREQCRAQKDNSTLKKFSKRMMNFKMKR